MTDDNPHAAWTKELFDIFSHAGISVYPYIPDAGNKRLIELAEAANETKAVLLTTEEEGIAVCAGAELCSVSGLWVDSFRRLQDVPSSTMLRLRV